jgi:hypothetical protein
MDSVLLFDTAVRPRPETLLLESGEALRKVFSLRSGLALTTEPAYDFFYLFGFALSNT